MTSSQQDTTPRRGPIAPADERPARSARQDGSQHTLSAADVHGAPRWNPDDGDYS